MGRIAALALACLMTACGSADTAATSRPAAADCGGYAAPAANVGAEIQHLKTSATVIEVTGPCTLRVRIGGGAGTLATFADRVIVVRAIERTTFKTAPQGDLRAIGRFGLEPGDVFTLSFDSRPFPDGSYPLNFMNW